MLKRERAYHRHSGFTLLELMVVIIIVALVAALIGLRSGGASYWRDESAIRQIAELIPFLFSQSIADGQPYQLEIDLKNNRYKIGVLTADAPTNAAIAQLTQDAGHLSVDLAMTLNPPMNAGEFFAPAPQFPTLSEGVSLPDGMIFTEVRTMRGKIVNPERDSVDRDADPTGEGLAFIRFSPRGFSEFAVIHLKTKSEADVTILVNPFTGLTSIIRQYKDFQWTYRGRRDESFRGL